MTCLLTRVKIRATNPTGESTFVRIGPRRPVAFPMVIGRNVRQLAFLKFIGRKSLSGVELGPHPFTFHFFSRQLQAPSWLL